MTVWQDSWTFRIVDQDTGAAVPGVPVSVLESGGGAGGYWVSAASRSHGHALPRPARDRADLAVARRPSGRHVVQHLARPGRRGEARGVGRALAQIARRA